MPKRERLLRLLQQVLAYMRANGKEKQLSRRHFIVYLSGCASSWACPKNASRPRGSVKAMNRWSPGFSLRFVPFTGLNSGMVSVNMSSRLRHTCLGHKAHVHLCHLRSSKTELRAGFSWFTDPVHVNAHPLSFSICCITDEVSEQVFPSSMH
ncbi:hypothetical protein CGRA01v4_04937 [Colletotrichum graminicola]|nr:hypothetical protein CGRA01v4_04937 [Colletotrichum graminicola]